MGGVDEYVFYLGCKGTMDIFVLRSFMLVSILFDLSTAFIQAIESNRKAREKDCEKTITQEAPKK